MLRRRIKFVAEKAVMARLFRAGTNAELQEELFRRLKPRKLASFTTQKAYDKWLLRTIQSKCWRPFSRNGLAVDRWAYFAKLINIIIYEIVSNRELFSDTNWRRIRRFLHVPIDSSVVDYVTEIDCRCPRIKTLKGMSKTNYLDTQKFIRDLAKDSKVPPIWFEAAWTA